MPWETSVSDAAIVYVGLLAANVALFAFAHYRHHELSLECTRTRDVVAEMPRRTNPQQRARRAREQFYYSVHRRYLAATRGIRYVIKAFVALQVLGLAALLCLLWSSQSPSDQKPGAVSLGASGISVTFRAARSANATPPYTVVAFLLAAVIVNTIAVWPILHGDLRRAEEADLIADRWFRHACVPIVVEHVWNARYWLPRNTVRLAPDGCAPCEIALGFDDDNLLLRFSPPDGNTGRIVNLQVMMDTGKGAQAPWRVIVYRGDEGPWRWLLPSGEGDTVEQAREPLWVAKVPKDALGCPIGIGTELRGDIGIVYEHPAPYRMFRSELGWVLATFVGLFRVPPRRPCRHLPIRRAVCWFDLEPRVRTARGAIADQQAVIGTEPRAWGAFTFGDPEGED